MRSKKKKIKANVGFVILIVHFLNFSLNFGGYGEISSVVRFYNSIFARMDFIGVLQKQIEIFWLRPSTYLSINNTAYSSACFKE
jgi:hypothetical protein